MASRRRKTREERTMKFMIKCALVLIPALVVAMPAFAQVRDTRLSDSQQPGSVIVFPKFINAPAVQVDGATLPRTEIELHVICPPIFVSDPLRPFCADIPPPCGPGTDTICPPARQHQS